MGKKVDLKITGDDLPRYLKHAGDGAEEALRTALLQEMQIAFRESQRLVPVDTGTLKASGQLMPPVSNGPGQVEISITYGGAASAYAGIIHADRSLNHPNGGQAGFASDPVIKRAAAMRSSLQSRMERALKK